MSLFLLKRDLPLDLLFYIKQLNIDFLKELSEDSFDEGNTVLPDNKTNNDKNGYLEKQEMCLHFTTN